MDEEFYEKTRKSLAKEGYTFVVGILPVSIGQLLANEQTSRHFGYVYSSEEMRSKVPPQMEVAINPKNLRIENSNFKSTDDQIGILKEEEADIKAKLPEDIRGNIGIYMTQNASILVQLDLEHKKRTGKALFTNWFGRTDDQTVPGRVIIVGRSYPSSRLFVHSWLRDGLLDVFAVPVVVLPRKSTV